jgi:hypothetical protein
MTNLQRLTKFILFLGIVMFSTLSFSVYVNAQVVNTNTDHAVTLLIATADSVLKANGVKAFKLDFAHAEPVRLMLLQKMVNLGYQVYNSPAESSAMTVLFVDPLLIYRLESRGKGQSIRTTTGTIGISLTRADGSVIATHVERVSETQPISANAGDLDDGTWTMVSFVSIENGGRRKSIKRIIEPALIITTAAVTIFLLFNVRSQ